MAVVPAGFTVAWPGAAAIPTGWVRESALDGRHPKGADAGADPGVTGGADTHVHTSAHSHTGSAHTHTGGTSGAGATDNRFSAGGASYAAGGHTHSIPTTGSVAHSLTAGSAAFGTSTSDPAFVAVRWIRSIGTVAGIPVGGWCWWDAAVLPASWSSPAAARGVYLKGATAGSDGGATGGSLAAHSHTGSAHTHPFGAHAHTGGTSGSASATVTLTTSTAGWMGNSNHTHPVTVVSAPTTAASGSTTSAATGSTTAEVPNIILGVIQNDTAGVAFPIGVIGYWLGLRSAIPRSLVACDGTGGTRDTRGRYVKGATLSGADFASIGTTGGAATHDHTDPATHTHSAAHVHSVSLAQASGSSLSPGASASASPFPHTHTGGPTGSSGGTSGAASQTVDIATNSPMHSTVIYVKYAGSIDVTVTSPTVDTVLTSSIFTATWTLSAGTQTDRRIRIYASDQATVIYDTGVVVSATASYDIPAAAGLRNGQSYYLQVSVTNNSAVPGDSTLIPFTTLWTPPATIGGFSATPVGGT